MENEKTKNEELSYHIGNLYVVTLGLIKNINNAYYIKDFEKKFIIYRASDKNKFLIGISPITKNKYYYANNKDIVRNFVGQMLIVTEIPLAYYKNDKTYLSVREIREIEDSFNQPQNEEKEIQDRIIQEIKRLAEEAKKITNESFKQQVVISLNKLGAKYINELIKIRIAETKDIAEREATLIEICLRELLVIEETIKIGLENKEHPKGLSILQRILNK